jgi:hypothetical protein
MKHSKLLISTTIVVASAGSALAGIAPPAGWDIQVTPDGGATWSAVANPGSWTATQETGPGGQPRWRIQGSAISPGGDWDIAFNMLMDPDPFVSNAFTLHNMTGITQAFVVTTIIPAIPALIAPTTMTGSVSGTVGDGDGLPDPNGNGATVTTFGSAPYYEALVDGAGVRQLYTSPQVHAAPLSLTQSIATQNFINEVGPAVNSTIGIRNIFTLTSADNASFTSTFLIVPAPAAAAAFGLVGVFGGRRRR